MKPVPPDELLELEDELLLEELLVDELLLDELLLEDELLDELLLEEDGSPPPHAASIALSIPMTSILRIIVIAPHVTPTTNALITRQMDTIGRFHMRF